MSRSTVIILAATLGLSASVQAQTGPSPVLVELYQSQGCSSCPPANANINAIADRPDVLPLSFAVTYWDQLGWKDTFDKPQFTARQWDYAHAAGRQQVATPQVVLNGGKATVVGSNKQQLEAAIRQARNNNGPQIAAAGGKVMIGRAAAARPATVWLVRYDPRPLNVAIRAGENSGRTLPHRNIVRSLQAIGTWTGPAASFAIPANPNPAYRTAVFIQSGKGGPVAAARRL